MATNGWMEINNVVCLYNGIACSHKKEWGFDTRCHMDEPWKQPAKWNKPDTEGQISYDPWFVESKKDDITEFIYKAETDSKI